MAKNTKFFKFRNILLRGKSPERTNKEGIQRCFFDWASNPWAAPVSQLIRPPPPRLLLHSPIQSQSIFINKEFPSDAQSSVEMRTMYTWYLQDWCVCAYKYVWISFPEFPRPKFSHSFSIPDKFYSRVENGKRKIDPASQRDGLVLVREVCLKIRPPPWELSPVISSRVESCWTKTGDEWDCFSICVRRRFHASI